MHNCSETVKGQPWYSEGTVYIEVINYIQRLLYFPLNTQAEWWAPEGGSELYSLPADSCLTSVVSESSSRVSAITNHDCKNTPCLGEFGHSLNQILLHVYYYPIFFIKQIFKLKLWNKLFQKSSFEKWVELQLITENYAMMNWLLLLLLSNDYCDD